MIHGFSTAQGCCSGANYISEMWIWVNHEINQVSVPHHSPLCRDNFRKKGLEDQKSQTSWDYYFFHPAKMAGHCVAQFWETLCSAWSTCKACLELCTAQAGLELWERVFQKKTHFNSRKGAFSNLTSRNLSNITEIRISKRY